jgi:hypothetical protein
VYVEIKEWNLIIHKKKWLNIDFNYNALKDVKQLVEWNVTYDESQRQWNMMYV